MHKPLTKTRFIDSDKYINKKNNALKRSVKNDNYRFYSYK